MLESPLLPSGAADTAGGDLLRIPAWAELSARLAAARDLRGVLATAPVRAAGSFTRFVALDPAPVNEARGSVNLTGLADVKCDQGKVPASQGDGEVAAVTRADRETR